MKAATPAPVANRWYDRVFRFCLYSYWALAAWNVALIAQHLAFIRGATHDGRSGIIRLLPAEPFSIVFGSKSLVFDWGLVVIMLFTVLAYVLLGMLGTLLYKAARWLAGGRRTVAILPHRVWCRVLLLVLLYWATCWVIYCFSGDVPNGDTELFYVMVANCGLLTPAAVGAGVMLYKILRWLNVFRKPYFMPNAEGADCIRRFVAGEDAEWEWDTFLTAPQTNPEVAQAVALCNHLESKYPARCRGQFCAPEGLACMLEVADALEQGLLADIVAGTVWWAQLDGNAAPHELLPWLRAQAALTAATNKTDSAAANKTAPE